MPSCKWLLEGTKDHPGMGMRTDRRERRLAVVTGNRLLMVYYEVTSFLQIATRVLPAIPPPSSLGPSAVRPTAHEFPGQNKNKKEAASISKGDNEKTTQIRGSNRTDGAGPAPDDEAVFGRSPGCGRSGELTASRNPPVMSQGQQS